MTVLMKKYVKQKKKRSKCIGKYFTVLEYFVISLSLVFLSDLLIEV